MKTTLTALLLAFTFGMPIFGLPAFASAEPYLVDAGRSPIPQPGETFDRPIAPTVLVRLSPIAPGRGGGDTGSTRADVETTPDAPKMLVPWHEAGEHIGQTITAEGVIVNTNNIGNLTFLNFHEDWRGKFYVVVFKDAYGGVPGGRPEAYYLDQRVRVTGRVDLHRGRPQIKVYDAHQIEVVE